MARREEFVAIHSEGGLLPAALLSRVAALDSDLDAIGAEAYYLARGEKLNDAVTRSWNRILGLWEAITQTLAEGGDLSAADTRKQLLLPLFQELGYGHLEAAGGLSIAGRSYPISHVWQRVPIHLLGTGTDLDRRTPGVAGAAQASPHGLVQELLNRSDQQLWAIVANGRTLRLLRDNASLTRQAYLEFDLETILDGQHYADFRLLWLIAHASRLDAEIPDKCVLEQWRLDAHQRGSRALDQLRDGVERAIEELGTGFVANPRNSELRAALQAGDLPTTEYYRQLLRVVYRIIFLLVAESRDLLHPPAVDPTAAQRYREHYSLQRLRTLAGRRGGGPHSDLWTGLQVVFRALGHRDGLPALGLPALGSALWSAETTERLNGAQLANRHLLAAIRALTTVADGKVVHAVDYRNLGAEELGSIYESLLEQHPEIDLPARRFGLATAAGNERKTTGSYYTPTSLIDQLLDTALDPVLDEAARVADPEHAILALTVLDPACGSGHFLIAAAHRVAQRLASVRSGEAEPAPNEVRAALRDVIGRCIHGIDINPMAVELCKVNLWLEAMTPGKPLSFLDHRIVCGNALLGATPQLLDQGVPDDAFRPITGDDNEVVKSLKKSNAKALTERAGQLTFDLSTEQLAKPLADAFAAVDAIGDDELADIETKERLWAELAGSDEAERARLAADAWCAAFVAKKVKGAPVITDRTVIDVASNRESVPPEVLNEIRRLRDDYRFLHPHLAFPHVFRVPEEGKESDSEKTGWSGGFSVVLGNPPWEQIQYDPREVLAASHPEIATAETMAKRNRLLAKLETEDPYAFERHIEALRRNDAIKHFAHMSGRYPLGSVGRLNTAPLFLELDRDMLSPTGRIGVVMPSGIATDSFTQDFFREIVDGRSLESLYDFENKQLVFPGVDSRVKFCLMTLVGSARVVDTADFVFFAYLVSDLADDGRHFTLSPSDFELLKPNTRTCPVFRSGWDAELVKTIYRRIPVLANDRRPGDDAWGFSSLIMFMMNTASHLFVDDPDPNADVVPLLEGKHIHEYDYRFTLPESLLSDPYTRWEETEVRYWLRVSEINARRDERWPAGCLLGWRSVARATDERTMISAFVPTVATSNTLLVGFVSERHQKKLPALLAVLNSFVLDYCLRQSLGGTDVRLHIVKQIPVPSPGQLSTQASWKPDATILDWLIPYVLELSYVGWELQHLASLAGFPSPPFRWNPPRRELLRSEVDAAVFHVYGVERGDVDYIMDTFPIVKRKDVTAHGEYRTKRLILEVYDAMAKAIETGEPYQTLLDPPPADPSLCHDPSTRPDWAVGYLQ